MIDAADNKIPYDMKCGKCGHIASEHWIGNKGVLYTGECRECFVDFLSCQNMCSSFVFCNLNYIEKLAERKNLI